MRCLSSLGLRSTVLESMVPCTQHRVSHSGWHIFCLLSPRHLNSAGQLWLLLGNEIMAWDVLRGSWGGKTAVSNIHLDEYFWFIATKSHAKENALIEMETWRGA